MFRLDLGKYSTNGGFLSPSLAAILYQTALGDFVYKTDSNGNVVLDNQGTLTSAYDGLPYSGRGIELGALNDVDIPIHHTLGAEDLNSTAPTEDATGGETTVFSSDTSNNFNMAVTSAGITYNKPRVNTNSLTSMAGKRVLVSFDIVVNSGTCILSQIYTHTEGYGTLNETMSTGHYEYYVDVVGTGLVEQFAFDGRNLFDISVTNWSVKQITNPNSYLTYYDFTDGLVTLGNSVDGGSSNNLEKVVNGTFDVDITGWASYLDAVLEWENGRAKITTVNSQGFITSSLISMSENKRFKVTVDIENANSPFIYINSVSVGANLTLISGNTYEAELTSISAITTIYIKGNVVNGQVCYLDNISIKEILPISTKYTLNTKTVNNVLKHATNWSASAWAKINNNPNLIGKLALETTGATKTIPELDMVMDAGASADSYYMCSEKSGAYLVDSRVAYGAANADVTSWLPQIDGVGNSITATATVGEYDIVQVVSTGSTFKPRIIFYNSNFVFGEKWKAKITITISSGSMYLDLLNIDGGTNVAIDETLSVGTHAFEYIIGTFSGGNAFHFDGTLATSCVSTVLVELFRVEATEIANYPITDTIRTNADLQQKGIQATAFVTDGAGVPTAYSGKLLQFNGDGRYVDTGWIPNNSNSFSIECVIEKISSGINWYFGTPADSRLYIGMTDVDKVKVVIGNMASLLLANALNIGDSIHIVMSFDTIQCQTFVNGVSVNISPTTLSAQTSSFLIGTETFLGLHVTDNIGLFKVHENKALTPTEVATAYAKAKAIYPTLP